jgi:hypothetical protein
MSSKQVKGNRYCAVKQAGKFFLFFRGYCIDGAIIMERWEGFFSCF